MLHALGVPVIWLKPYIDLHAVAKYPEPSCFEMKGQVWEALEEQETAVHQKQPLLPWRQQEMQLSGVGNQEAIQAVQEISGVGISGNHRVNQAASGMAAGRLFEWLALCHLFFFLLKAVKGLVLPVLNQFVAEVVVAGLVVAALDE